MFKLTSDPTNFPYREVSFRDDQVASKQITTPGFGYDPTNAVYTRPDRRRNVVFGPRMSSIRLDLSLLSREQVDGLYELTGMSAGGLSRTTILCFPAMDYNTILSAPLAQSTAAYEFLDSPGNFGINPGTYSRAATGYYRHPSKSVFGLAPGTALFNKSVIGNGITLNAGNPNLETAHPSSGDLVFSTAVGGTYVWTTNRKSSRAAEGGSGQWTNIALDELILATTITPAAGSQCYLRIDLTGNGVVDVELKSGADTFLRTDIALTDQWEPYTFGPVDNDGIDAGVNTRIIASQTGAYIATNYVGPISVQQSAVTTNIQPDEWTDIGSPAEDSLTYTALPVGSSEVTVIATGLVPLAESRADLWEMPDGVDTWRLGWDEGGPQFIADGHVSPLVLSPAFWQGVEGTPYTMIGRASKGLVTIDWAWQVPAAPGGYLFQTGASASVGIKPPNTTTHFIGGSGTKHHTGPATIQNVHVLSRAIDDAEVQFTHSLYLLPGWQNLLFDCGYRLFECSSLNIGPARSKPDFYNGSIALREIAPVDGMSYSR